MAFSFKLWTDSGMTTEFDWEGGDKLQFDTDGDSVLYFGSNDPTKECQAVGGGDIVLTPTDAGGDAHAATEIKLASTSAGLDSATGGSTLTITGPLAGGTASPIHIRMTDSTGGGVASTALSIEFNNLEEQAI